MNTDELVMKISTQQNPQGYNEDFAFRDILGARVSSEIEFSSRLLEIYVYNKLYEALQKKQTSGILCFKSV